MARALENPAADPTFLEFFGFTRPPFARLSKPSQVFHTEQYSLLMSHLASATEQPDCLVVICGADGSGKTTLLNRYIASLNEDISFATVDESCTGEKQFYCKFLRQLGFTDITGTPRELRRITKEFLVHRGMSGDPFLMVVDNAHLINPTVLEQLRRLSAIKIQDRRVLSVVLTGNSDLASVMDSPAMSQLKFRSQIRFNIRVYTEDETANYVRHHLKLAGGKDAVSFSDDAHPLIYRYTGGIPKLINMLCNDVFQEAYALESHDITEDLVRTVADKQRLSPHVVPLQGKGRRRTDPDFKLVQPEGQTGERITPRDASAKEPAEQPTPESATPESTTPESTTPESTTLDADGRNLLVQISELSDQVGNLRADRMRAIQDVGTRDKEISELRNQINAQITETETLTSTLADNSDEIGRLNQALSGSKKAVSEIEKTLSESKKALQKSERSSKKLNTDLAKERNATKAAQADFEKARSATEAAKADFAKAKATADELTHLKSELQAAIGGLTADLKQADDRVVEIGVLEKKTTNLKDKTAILKDEIENKADAVLTLQGKLDARDESVGNLEELLQESQDECASLRIRDAALKNLEESVPEKDARIADLKAELASYSEEIEALKAKNEDLESSDTEQAQAERISALESELQEARESLATTEAQLTENAKTNAQPDTEAQSEAEPEDQLAAGEISDGPDSAANQPGAIGPAFEVLKDGKVERVVEVPQGQLRIMIGRSEDSELHLDSRFVSRHHALITCTEQGLCIEDLNSFNGTIVNSEKINRCELGTDDIIMIGKFEIKLRQP